MEVSTWIKDSFLGSSGDRAAIPTFDTFALMVKGRLLLLLLNWNGMVLLL